MSGHSDLKSQKFLVNFLPYLCISFMKTFQLIKQPSTDKEQLNFILTTAFVLIPQ